MKHITSKDGTQIGYGVERPGLPLLLVHGTTADHSRWLPIIPELREDFTVYYMDRRGRGESGDAPEYDLIREAEDIAAVVEAIGEPVYLVGHSYGSICCLEAALRTDKISKLVLYEPPIPNNETPDTSKVASEIQAFVDKGDLEAGLELFFKEIVKMPDDELKYYRGLSVWQERIKLCPTIAREMRAADAYKFDESKFLNLKLPVMLMLGGESPGYFRKAAEMVFSAIPDSLVVVLPDQRHVAMDTAPDLFVEELVKFLQEE